MSQAAFTAVVYGRVQMVTYRDFARKHALRLGVVGEAANLHDGTVRVIAEGPKEALERFLKELHHGPALARVKNLRVTWQEPTGVFTGFTSTFRS